MNILYISTFSSQKLINNIYEKTGLNPGYSIQKFTRLLAKGFVHHEMNFQALSTPPINREHTKKFWINLGSECEHDINYKYIPFINIPVLRHMCVFLYTFFYVFFGGFKNKNDKVLICDVLSVSACLGALLASKCNRMQSVALVTDIYDFLVTVHSSRIKIIIRKIAGLLNRTYIKSFNRYILLTEAMNDLVNPKHKPYLVMEALCDSSLAESKVNHIEKAYPKVIMYAGGLHERYGLKMLVDAFKTIDDQNVELHLYGSGPYVETLIEATKKDRRIKYWGVINNEEILKAEYKATLLVNPRFTTEEFTKYSFPSKNMEYMVSGTPLLTTKLPGMPKEYYPYVFLFEEETIESYAQTIKSVLTNSDEYLVDFGMKAKNFVLKEKNNIIQTKRIIYFLL